MILEQGTAGREKYRGAPELPAPMTSTRFPASGRGERYWCECSSSPAKLPGSCGQAGSQWCPFATSTALYSRCCAAPVSRSCATCSK
jgi:hypothetical protein